MRYRRVLLAALYVAITVIFQHSPCCAAVLSFPPRLLFHVYDIPERLLLGGVKKYRLNGCLQREATYAGYALESKFPGMVKESRYHTADPSTADYYIVPHWARCVYTTIKKLKSNSRMSSKDLIGRYLTKIIAHVGEAYPYLNKSKGHDHILASPRDFGRCPLRPTQNFTSVQNYGHASTMKVSLPLPCADYCSSNRVTRRFAIGRDMVVPQFSVGKSVAYFLSLHCEQSEAPASCAERVYNARSVFHRRYLFVFRGSIGNGKVRKILHPLYKDTPQAVFSGIHLPAEEAMEELMAARYCLLPDGWAPWSHRWIDALMAGCVPVVISDTFVPPFGARFSHYYLHVSVEEAADGKLADDLGNLHWMEFRKVYERLQEVRHRIIFNERPAPGDGLDTMVDILWERKMTGCVCG